MIHSSSVDLDIFNQEIKENQIYDLTLKELDVGFKTIQLATILAQDIILKLVNIKRFET